MTEDAGTIQVNTNDVFARYRSSTEAEMTRMRLALAQAETAVDVVQRENDELRRQLRSNQPGPLARQLSVPEYPDSAFDDALTREMPRQP
jgi:hypothetical protein